MEIGGEYHFQDKAIRHDASYVIEGMIINDGRPVGGLLVGADGIWTLTNLENGYFHLQLKSPASLLKILDTKGIGYKDTTIPINMQHNYINIGKRSLAKDSNIFQYTTTGAQITQGVIFST